MYYFILTQGQPVHESATPATVSTAPTRIDYQWTTQQTGSAMAATTSADKPGQRRTVLSSGFTTLTAPVTREEFAPGANVAAV